MGQYFFLVVLPGIAPYAAMLFIGYFLYMWLAPKVAHKRAEAKFLSHETKQLQKYNEEAHEVIAALVLELSTGACPDMDQDMKQKAYMLAADNPTKGIE